MKVVLVRVCFNRHVVEMLRLKKGNFSPRSFVCWAFYATMSFIVTATLQFNNRVKRPWSGLLEMLSDSKDVRVFTLNHIASVYKVACLTSLPSN